MKGSLHDIVIKNVHAEDVEIPVIIAGFRQNGKTKYVENAFPALISVGGEGVFIMYLPGERSQKMHD